MFVVIGGSLNVTNHLSFLQFREWSLFLAGEGGGKGAGFYEGHKVFRGGTEGISRCQQSLKGGDYRKWTSI